MCRGLCRLGMARALENMKRPGGRVATKREVSWSHFRRDIFLPIASNSFLNQGYVSREIFSFIGQGGANSSWSKLPPFVGIAPVAQSERYYRVSAKQTLIPDMTFRRPNICRIA